MVKFTCMHVLFCKAVLHQSHALAEPAKKPNRMDADDWKFGS